MAEPSAHLSGPTLQQLVEGTLPAAERGEANAHLSGCARCGAELEAYQSLFAMLREVPRLEPSADFADQVMARVRIAPRENPALAWLRRWVPATRRGWALAATAALAPALPLIALIAWVLSNPLLSPLLLAQWSVMRVQATAQAAMGWLLEATLERTLRGLLEPAYAALQTLPPSLLGGALALFGVAIPLSAWTLYRLLRTPTGSVTHAN